MSDEEDVARRLRVKERKLYLDEGLDDDEIDGKRTFNLENKLTSGQYNETFVKEIKGDKLNYKYIQENGFVQPFVLYDKAGLEMRMVSTDFKVNDVKQCVGSRRTIDVIDVNTQKGVEMSMKDWVKYYESKDKDRLLNVISLEFSHTRLENYIECPKIVRQLDWVECAWPRHFKQGQTESTNVLEKMKYPKVQKYCLMSVKGCYTDFHVDFGGTSVWYHLLHGSKIFWMIPPSEKNLDLYENWVKSGKQGDTFFADKVEKCQRIKLEAGYTFLIPSGWIHAVYTPEDSLVFGGNFLHSFGITKQLRISQVEDSTHVRQKFRYPFFVEIMWYVIERYVHTMSDKTYLNLVNNENQSSQQTHDADCESETFVPGPPKLEMIEAVFTDNESQDELEEFDDSSPPQSPPVMDEHNYVQSPPQSPEKSNNSIVSEKGIESTLSVAVVKLTDTLLKKNTKSMPSKLTMLQGGIFDNKENTSTAANVPRLVHLTQQEWKGLNELVEYLDNLPESKKSIPHFVTEPAILLQAAKDLLADHSNDDPQKALNGEPVFSWPTDYKIKTFHAKPSADQTDQSKPGKTQSHKKGGHLPSTSNRRRRTRCKRCEPCTRKDCRECHYCKDMKKFGGFGRLKQCCLSKRCLAPVLPWTSTCLICESPTTDREEQKKSYENLMECGLCWEILHPICLKEKYENIDLEKCQTNEDLPNSWECPKCYQGGANAPGELKLKKTRETSLISRDSRSSSMETLGYQDNEAVIIDSNKREETILKQDTENVDQNVKTETTHEKIEGAKKVEKVEDVKEGRKRKIAKDDKTGDSKPKTRKTKTTETDREATTDTSSVATSSRRPHRQTDDYEQNTMEAVGGKRRGRKPTKPKPTDNSKAEQANQSPTNLRRSPRNVQNSLRMKLKELKVKVDTHGHVVRPAPLPPSQSFILTPDGSKHPLEHTVWLKVFSYLEQPDLSRCFCVCKQWTQWCCDRIFWNKINLSGRQIKQNALMGIVRRQPAVLALSHTNINRKQLVWLLPRLPQLKSLDMEGNSWNAVSALCTASCPFLSTLSLKWVTGVDDDSIVELVTPSGDRKPGQQNSSRVRQITCLELSGSDITDKSITSLINAMPKLSKLNLSHCVKLTNASIQAMVKNGTNTKENLVDINLSFCSRITSDCIDLFKKAKKLECIDLQSCNKISKVACQRFVESSRNKYTILKDKLIVKKH